MKHDYGKWNKTKMNDNFQVLLRKSLYYGLGVYVLIGLSAVVLACVLPYETLGQTLDISRTTSAPTLPSLSKISKAQSEETQLLTP